MGSAAAPKWDVEHALDLAAAAGVEGEVASTLSDLRAALNPASSQWFGKRLPVFWTLFMAARPADPRALTIWMAETARLLGDIPQDIVAYAIDEAIRTSGHGFMPSVGEIRSIADPLIAERRLYVQRLVEMEAALADPAARTRRVEARRAKARHLEFSPGFSQ